jgi:hypothetical protein
MAATRVRPTDDPRFQYVLMASRLNPGTMTWKLMRMEEKPETNIKQASESPYNAGGPSALIAYTCRDAWILQESGIAGAIVKRLEESTQ